MRVTRFHWKITWITAVFMTSILVLSFMHYDNHQENLYQPIITRDIAESSRKVIFNKNSSQDRMHLVSIVRGQRAWEQIKTMMKSLLFQQGRYNAQHNNQCFFEIADKRVKICSSPSTTQWSLIRIHWIADENMLDAMGNWFQQLQWKEVELNLYSVDKLMSHVPNFPAPRTSGPATVFKMSIPYILPLDITKVLFLDTDVLFNDDVRTLWAYFEQFLPTQVSCPNGLDRYVLYSKCCEALGAACEQMPECQSSCQLTYRFMRVSFTVIRSIPDQGINSGIMLLNLAKLRSIGWDEIWKRAAANQLSLISKLWLGDQGIFNTALISRPELLYRLPCEWNIQTYSSGGPECCPADWRVRIPQNLKCSLDPVGGLKTVTTRLAKALHYNTAGKPEEYFPRKQEEPECGSDTSIRKLYNCAIVYQF
ncbi:glycosyltransferase-like protein LARGE [Paragonimus westermani]|uniref:Glycosyltransferase-like protein LARGE n=1 Tax=Paragonimus westermani TaxID=34504 RepID=A0A5J4NPW5_9TREM|nr:glycosyltransferase-like protein LARGE [Paragonimus westermani]